MRKLLACVSAAALLVAGCGQSGGSGGGSAGGGGDAQVNAEQVTPEALKAAVKDERVKKFYEARGWAAVWNDKLAGELTQAFGDAQAHAINPESYLKTAKTGASAAEREAGLTLAALDYAQALSSGMVDPSKLFEVYEVGRNKVDVAAGLGQAIEQGGVRTWLAGLAPQDDEYKALQQAYAGYAKQAAGEQRQMIQPGDKIEKGDKDPRVPAIAAALRANGYLASSDPAQPDAKPAGGGVVGKAKAAPAKPAAAAPSTVFTAQMAEAVKKVQAAYGIKPDGVIGNATIEALNTGAKERARILAVNLERRRWLERTLPQTRIDVNTAAAELSYFRDGNLANKRRVVVGQPEWETPELASPMTRLIANPPWTVPESIAEEEIKPKGAAYLAKENIKIENGRYVQQPGPKSALGLVKFDMDNAHAIYLHDTPAKALFASTERHASHGCARVENAIDFARLIAKDEGQLEAFDKALATKKETSVSLPSKIPVRLLYHSAYFDGGKVVFRTDPYAWDDKVAQAMGLPGQIRPRVQTHVTDVGP
jgi:murein L,D-transpeptidase YcbB/YkuD